MDAQQAKVLQDRTDAKLRYAKVHLDELVQQSHLSGDDFDRAHQESFLFHLFGARDALLQELNHYYGINLASERLSPGTLREALKEQGAKSPELSVLYELEQDEPSWFRQAKDMRDHSTHVQGVTRHYRVGGEDHGKVKLKNPRTGGMTARDLREEFQEWLVHMATLVQALRKSALERQRSSRSPQNT